MRLLKGAFVFVLFASVAGCGQHGSSPVSPITPSIAQSSSVATPRNISSTSSLTPANGVFRDLSADTIQSDGLGPYIDGQSGVTSAINIGGNYELDLLPPNRNSRGLKVLAPASYGTGCTLPFQQETMPADLANQEISHLNRMAVGASSQVTVVIAIYPAETPSTEYYLTYDPTRYSDSSYITATRTSSTTWTLEASSQAVAKIETVGTKGRSTRVGCGEAQGMPFLITVTLQ